MITSALFASALAAIVKELSAHMHPLQIGFFRCFFGFVVLTPAFYIYGLKILKTQNLKLHLMRGSINTVSLILWFTALGIVPLAKATALGFTSPLFVTILAVIFLHEMIRIRRVVALLFGFVGMLVIIRPGYIDIDYGTIIMLLASLTWAINLVVIKKLSYTDSSITIALFMTIFLTPILFFASLPFWITPTLEQMILLFLTGLFGSLAHLFLNHSFKMADTSIIMPAAYTKLLWAAMLGYYFFAEVVSLWTWIGGLIIMLSVIYIAYRESIYSKNKESRIIPDSLQSKSS